MPALRATVRAVLHYPFDAIPAPGETLSVAPGVQWLRMPLHERLEQLQRGHEKKLARLLEALAAGPLRALDLFGAVFGRLIGPEQLIFATGECLAHLHCLMGRGMVERSTDAGGVHWYSRSISSA